MGALLVIVVGLTASVPVEQSNWHPKLVYRQIGGGYSLALELNRQPKTFFLCAANKTDCMSVTAIGWRKPFIIIRTGGEAPGFDVLNTSSKKSKHFMTESAFPSYVQGIPLSSTSAAWEKLSPTKPLW